MRIVRAIVLLWINSLPFFQLLAQEYNTERFKIAAATNESLKRQMGLVEDRNRQLDRISAQHEASVTALREELREPPEAEQGRAGGRQAAAGELPSHRPAGCYYFRLIHHGVG